MAIAFSRNFVTFELDLESNQFLRKFSNIPHIPPEKDGKNSFKNLNQFLPNRIKLVSFFILKIQHHTDY